MSGENKRYVLITGAAGGLGRAVSAEVTKYGFTPVLTDLPSAELKELSEKLNALYVPCDMVNSCPAETIAGFLKEHSIIPYGVVHLAGGKVKGDGQPVSALTLEQSLRLNLGAAAELNTALVPDMAHQGGGRIIHISSDAAETGNASPAYAASKGALNTYIKSMARYHAKENILFCAIMPAIMDHPTSDWNKKKSDEPERYARKIEEMPLGRFGHPEEVAELAVSVLNLKGMLLTGAVIKANGGL